MDTNKERLETTPQGYNNPNNRSKQGLSKSFRSPESDFGVWANINHLLMYCKTKQPIYQLSNLYSRDVFGRNRKIICCLYRFCLPFVAIIILIWGSMAECSIFLLSLYGYACCHLLLFCTCSLCAFPLWLAYYKQNMSYYFWPFFSFRSVNILIYFALIYFSSWIYFIDFHCYNFNFTLE